MGQGPDLAGDGGGIGQGRRRLQRFKGRAPARDPPRLPEKSPQPVDLPGQGRGGKKQRRRGKPGQHLGGVCHGRLPGQQAAPVGQGPLQGRDVPVEDGQGGFVRLSGGQAVFQLRERREFVEIGGQGG